MRLYIIMYVCVCPQKQPLYAVLCTTRLIKWCSGRSALQATRLRNSSKNTMLAHRVLLQSITSPVWSGTIGCACLCVCACVFMYSEHRYDRLQLSYTRLLVVVGTKIVKGAQPTFSSQGIILALFSSILTARCRS